LNPDAGQEADQDGTGDEVGQEAETGEAREEEEPRGEQSTEARKGEPLGCVRLQPGDAQRGDARKEDRGGGRVAADDEMTRRAEDGERDDRDQDRVQAGDYRRAGDLRVAPSPPESRGRRV
jgi:hypothetical protein